MSNTSFRGSSGHEDGSAQRPISIVVFGASGDLAKRQTLPALYFLYRNGYLPLNPPTRLNIFGYARTALSTEDFRNKVKGWIMSSRMHPDQHPTQGDDKFSTFLTRLQYIRGGYDDLKCFESLNETLRKVEDKNPIRIFYFAVPPGVFVDVAKGIHIHVTTENPMDTRLIIEKPFGKDLNSSNLLQKELSSMFSEKQIFRMDHYLGKEMVKNLLVLRFANFLMGSVWSRSAISNIQISFKEPFGIEGRGGYFDEYGIIRDVIQNHLLQVVCLIGMERPVTLDSEAIRDEKVRLLKSVVPIDMNEVVLGQYEGYQQDETVPIGSLAATYAALVLRINNERWYGVPIIIKCGKGLDTKKTEIRIQFRDCPGNIFDDALARNELVIRVSPSEAVYLKMMNKKPGIAFETVISELDLTYKERYSDVSIPEAYESLILDVLNGDHANFVRSDELQEAWRIFTPVLQEIDSKKIHPQIYPFGSRGPSSADELVLRCGFVMSPKKYLWKSK